MSARLGHIFRYPVKSAGGESLDRVVLTPACGMAGWTPRAVSTLLRALGTTAERMGDELSR